MAATIVTKQFTLNTSLSREASARPLLNQARQAVNNQSADSVQVGGEHTCYNQQMANEAKLKTMRSQMKISLHTSVTPNGNSSAGQYFPKESAQFAQGPGLPTGATNSSVTFVDSVGLAPVLGPFDVVVQAHLPILLNPPRPIRPTGLPFLNKLPQNEAKTGWMVPSQVRTERGNWIDVYYHVKTKDSDPGMDSNCHGRTFLNGKLVLQPDKLGEFLLGDNWTTFDPKKSPFQVNDVIIFNRPNDPMMHSERVISLDPVMVTGESGMEVEPHVKTLEEATDWQGKFSLSYWRKE